MRNLKKFESFNTKKPGKYYTDEEIMDFFQEFMDENDFEIDREEHKDLYYSSWTGEYYIDMRKIIPGSNFNYSSNEDDTFWGYQNPSQLLKSMNFMNDLDAPIQRLKSLNYDFGCEFEIYFEEDIRFFLRLRGSYLSK
jgi:hypothetical protein